MDYELFILGQRWALKKYDDELLFFETDYTIFGERLTRRVSIPHRGVTKKITRIAKNIKLREKELEYILTQETERILKEKLEAKTDSIIDVDGKILLIIDHNTKVIAVFDKKSGEWKSFSTLSGNRVPNGKISPFLQGYLQSLKNDIDVSNNKKKPSLFIVADKKNNYILFRCLSCGALLDGGASEVCPYCGQIHDLSEVFDEN